MDDLLYHPYSLTFIFVVQGDFSTPRTMPIRLKEEGKRHKSLNLSFLFYQEKKNFQIVLSKSLSFQAIGQY